jgi:predicted lipoprotein with Yx(FWY)xxD motif
MDRARTGSTIAWSGRWLAVAAATLIAVAACTSPAGGGATPGPTNSPPTTPPATTAASQAAAGLTLEVKTDAKLGAHVVGKDGLSLYVFEKDTGNTSACVDTCATNWPPLTVASASDVKAGSGVTGEIGTIKRPDGSTQVTLDGKPLYYFGNDKAAGDTNGQALNDLWYLVSPTGEAVGEEEAKTPEPMGSGCTSGRYCY